MTQYGNNGYFANFAWDFLVLSLASENEIFDWAWINARRNPFVSLNEALELAPESWRAWVRRGQTAMSSVRRYVAKRSLLPERDQKPEAGTRLARILAEVRETYRNQEARFEGIVAWVAERLLSPSGTYRAHGVTRATGDRGFDFVGRLDLGEGFGAIKLVVLGQAKCEAIESATSGRDIARTVARLRRGWIGVYVTTGYFSRSTQTEVMDELETGPARSAYANAASVYLFPALFAYACFNSPLTRLVQDAKDSLGPKGKTYGADTEDLEEILTTVGKAKEHSIVHAMLTCRDSFRR